MRLLSPAGAWTPQAGPLRLNPAPTRPMSPNAGSRSPGAPNDGCDKSPEAIAVVGTIPLVILEITSDFCGFVMVVTPPNPGGIERSVARHVSRPVRAIHPRKVVRT